MIVYPKARLFLSTSLYLVKRSNYYEEGGGEG